MDKDNWILFRRNFRQGSSLAGQSHHDVATPCHAGNLMPILTSLCPCHVCNPMSVLNHCGGVSFSFLLNDTSFQRDARESRSPIKAAWLPPCSGYGSDASSVADCDVWREGRDVSDEWLSLQIFERTIAALGAATSAGFSCHPSGYSWRTRKGFRECSVPF